MKKKCISAFLNWWVAVLFWLGHDFVGSFPVFKRDFKMHIFTDKMLVIYVEGHTIQFNNFNLLLTKHNRRWASIFYFCETNLGRNFMIRKKKRCVSWDSTGWEPLTYRKEVNQKQVWGSLSSVGSHAERHGSAALLRCRDFPSCLTGPVRFLSASAEAPSRQFNGWAVMSWKAWIDFSSSAASGSALHELLL